MKFSVSFDNIHQLIENQFKEVSSDSHSCAWNFPPATLVDFEKCVAFAEEQDQMYSEDCDENSEESYGDEREERGAEIQKQSYRDKVTLKKCIDLLKSD